MDISNLFLSLTFYCIGILQIAAMSIFEVSLRVLLWEAFSFLRFFWISGSEVHAFLFVVNFNVLLQGVFSWKSVATDFTLEIFDVFVYIFLVSIQVTISSELYSTYIAFKIFSPFMNNPDVWFEAYFIWKGLIAKFTFSKNFLFMNISDMHFNILYALTT